jgi:Spy/CpxP family protein refolding chaperone
MLKLMPMLAGAIALTLTSAPLVVKAESPSAITVAQAQKPEKWQNLNLTPEQRTRMAEIRSQTRSQIEAVLTPQQREQLKATMQESRQKRREAFANLNLTPEQKAQMRQIKQSAKSQFEAVLTPEQQQQLQQFRENRRSQRQNQF